MRHRAVKWGVASLFLLAGGAGSPASRAAAARQDDPATRLRTLEDRWLASEDDPDSLAVYLADDFIHVLALGFVTKAEQIAVMRHQPRSRLPRPKHFEDLRVRVYGDVGIVNGIVVADTGNGGLRRTLFTDVFVRRAGRWQAVNAQELPEGR